MSKSEFTKENEVDWNDFPKGSKVLYWRSINEKCAFPEGDEQPFEVLESVEETHVVTIDQNKWSDRKNIVFYPQIVAIESLDGILHCMEDENCEDYQ